MFDIYCNFCLEQGVYVPATMELCVQRQDGSATQYIRCCDRHKTQAVVTAELMQHNMSPAIIASKALHGEAATAHST
jgi:hypothetical protein